MPNWSFNTIAIQGKCEDVHELIKIGLKNSNLEPIGKIEDDWKLLVSEGKTKSGCHFEKDESGNEISVPDFTKGLTARTFFPMPDTFLLYDTTNCANEYPIEISKEQRDKYGAIGWYDYNCLTLGTKWNFDLGTESEPVCTPIDGHNGYWRISFYCETAWSLPVAWLINIKKLVPELFVGVMAYEESGAYYCVEYVEGERLCSYGDFTSAMDKLYADYEKARVDKKNELLADESFLQSVKDENPDIYEIDKIEFEKKIESKIWDILDDEYGMYPDTDDVMCDLENCFEEMIEEFLD